MDPVWFLWQPEAIIVIIIPDISTLNFEEIETPICVIDDIGQLAIPIPLSTRIESRYIDTSMYAKCRRSWRWANLLGLHMLRCTLFSSKAVLSRR